MNNLQRLWANGSVKFGVVVLGTMICVALLAPFLKAGNYTNDYPIFISKDGSQCKSLVNLIEEAFDASFVDDEAKILRANLPRILRDFKAEVVNEKHFALFSKAWSKAEADLHSVDVHGDKQKLYTDHIEKLKKVIKMSINFVLNPKVLVKSWSNSISLNSFQNKSTTTRATPVTSTIRNTSLSTKVAAWPNKYLSSPA